MLKTRLYIKNNIYHKPKAENMFYVAIVYRDAFDNLEFSRSYFENRYDAERFISLITKNMPCYYYYYDGESHWKNIDELLGGE